MEALARRILTKPLEVTVGGKSVVCDDVTQNVTVLSEEDKFLKLLELLGQSIYELYRGGPLMSANFITSGSKYKCKHDHRWVQL